MIQAEEATLDELNGIVCIDAEVIGGESRRNYLENSIEERRCLLVEENKRTVGFLVFDRHFFHYGFISLVR